MTPDENEDFLDLTASSDEEDIKPKAESPSHTKMEMSKSTHISEHKFESKQRSCKSSPVKNEPSELNLSGVKHFQDIDKAVSDIKKGGSLVVVALQYGISEDVLYEKLVSRILPKEMDILTDTEENNLIKWIVRSNQNNSLVFKQQLMEKVGKLKKITKITPIFAKSKFGRMWYEYFLRSHPEIYENDGLLMPSSDISEDSNNSSGQWPDEEDIKLAQQRFKTESVKDPSDNEWDTESNHIESEEHGSTYLSTENINSGPKICDKEYQHPIENNSAPQVYDEEHHSAEPATSIKNISTKSRTHDREYQNLKSKGNHANAEKKFSDCRYEKKDSDLGCLKPQKKKFNKVIHKCAKCHKAFSDKGKLKRHLARHEPKELYNFTCYKCHKLFASKFRLLWHLRTSHYNKYYICFESDKIFKHTTSMTHHKKNIHSDINIKSSCSRFICDTCGKSYKCKNRLEAHIICSHLKEETSFLICDMCKKSFTYKSNLEAHIMHSHLNKGKRFACFVCNKTFIQFSLMIRHKLKHTKIKQFSCLHCKETYSNKRLLRKHAENCFDNEKMEINKECDQISREFLDTIALD